MITLFSAIATSSTSAITSGMSAEVAAEFKAELNKQVSLQHSPLRSWNLSMMKNPYKKFFKIIKKKLRDEAGNGSRRRLMTRDEGLLKAKKIRFNSCQSSIVNFVGFSRNAYTFSHTKYPLTKDEIMKDNGLADYPFTQKQANDITYRPNQIAVELGWQYQGQGEAHIETFFKTCLDIPIEIYYWEDKFDEDE